MSNCVHEKYHSATLYEPAEYWCNLNEDHDCENCPYYLTHEDYDSIFMDIEYEDFRESFDF